MDRWNDWVFVFGQIVRRDDSRVFTEYWDVYLNYKFVTMWMKFPLISLRRVLAIQGEQAIMERVSPHVCSQVMGCHSALAASS